MPQARNYSEKPEPELFHTSRSMIVAIVSLVEALRQYRLLDAAQLDELAGGLQARFPDAKALARELIQRNWLTPFQANLLLQGRGKELLLGSYVLLERVGEGGMGIVFKARNWKLGRVVALKIIRKEKLDKPDAVRRFQREVRAAAVLSHPNIVHAHDADQIGGTHILVMEYIDGTIDLAALVKKNGPLPVPQACEYIRQAALGLQHAHERGLVHRDIKPHNLLLTANGSTVKILDMGLARLSQSALHGQPGTLMTQEGTVMGTPDYIAPEQSRSSHNVDIRADIYSLGCTLYHLLAGQAPFPRGSMIEKILKHQLDEPPPLEQIRPDVPPPVAALVRKMMAKKTEARYQTPAAVVAALTAALNAGAVPVAIPVEAPPAVPTVAESVSGETVEAAFDYMARRGEPTELLAKPDSVERQKPRRRIWPLLLGTTAVIVLGVLAGWAASRFKSPKTPGPTKTDSRPPKKELEKEFTNSIDMKLVLIPAGDFLMGSPDSEPGHQPNEGPQHKVTIPKPFYMGAHEVTQGQYEAVMLVNPSAHLLSADHPVDSVSWDDAVAFCQALSNLTPEKKAGRKYRLPTEAEWEYACRAGSKTAYSFGDDVLQVGEHAWFKENAPGSTQKVGTRKPNAWGLYDMHGNVWEWCLDNLETYPDKPTVNPRGSSKGPLYVIRGGGVSTAGTQWEAVHMRSAIRGMYSREMRTSNVGFRVVCEAPDAPGG